MKHLSFSHRPQAGISIAILTEGSHAYLAASFLHKRDRFSRKRAREILLSRIESFKSGKPIQYTYCLIVVNPLDSRDIMRHLRPTFKPDPHEADDTFQYSGSYGGVQMREDYMRDEAWDKIVAAFRNAATRDEVV